MNGALIGNACSSMRRLSRGKGTTGAPGWSAFMKPNILPMDTLSAEEAAESDLRERLLLDGRNPRPNRASWNTPFILAVCMAFLIAVFFFVAGSMLMPYADSEEHPKYAKNDPGVLGSEKSNGFWKRFGQANSTAAAAAYQGEVGVAAACKNRQSSLKQALPTWLGMRGLREIVIVDWSSDPPLQPIVSAALKEHKEAYPKVRVIRVEKEPSWVLSRAYNLAIKSVTKKVVLKLDCDYITSKNLLGTLKMDAKSFYTGYYMNSRNENEIHLNGAMIVSREKFLATGGYDERIQTYGAEDDDLYTRLKKLNLQRKNVSYDSIGHVRHNDSARVQDGVKFPQVSIFYNQLILEVVDKPWSNKNRDSEYKKIQHEASHLEAVYVPPKIQTMVNETIRVTKWRLALGARLSQFYDIPWTFIKSMETSMLEKLLHNLKVRQGPPVFHKKVIAPRIVFAHVQNGLGNRLRALGSALDFASQTSRECVIIWEADPHLQALYGDVFNLAKTKHVVIKRLTQQGPYEPLRKWDKAFNRFDLYDYMSDKKDEPIVDNPANHIYFKSAFTMKSKFTKWKTENEQLKLLPIRADIIDLVEKYTPSSFTNIGGAHIRNRTLAQDIKNVDALKEYTPADRAQLDKWRARTSYRAFVPEMLKILKKGTVAKFFVATDDESVVPKVRLLLGKERVISIPRTCDDRSAACVKYAMADILALARTKILLGSTWSSFTEAAMRYGAPKALLAGTDFGNTKQ